MNVKIEAKVKMAHILFVSIFLASGKIEKKKLIKEQVLVKDCHQNSVPPSNEIRVNQLTPNSPDFRGNKSKLIHPNSSHNKTEFCRQSLSN